MNPEKRIKQVIVMRHDLKMRRGKQIAQGAHASMSFICRRLQESGSVSFDDFTEAQRAWLTGVFAKVCCRVDSEEELMEIHDKALEAGLVPSLEDEWHSQDGKCHLANDRSRYRDICSIGPERFGAANHG